MTEGDYIELLRQGVSVWNAWRNQHRYVTPDLAHLDFGRVGVPLSGADFTGCNLTGAGFSSLILKDVIFNDSALNSARLTGTVLTGSSIRNANLENSNLSRADLYRVDLSDSRLTGARLVGTSLVETNLSRAELAGCAVYGAAVWRVILDRTLQTNLIISPPDEPTITVDNLEVAQFIYLLLNNQNIRHIIDTITSKVVLILGRFTPERKAILDAIRDELRKRDYLPVVFDFDKPANRDITETVSILAHMAKFVIADITDAKSIPQELMAIVPALPSVPVQPLLLASQQEYGMFEHFRRYPWVLEPFIYKDQDGLLASLTNKVIGPAEAKAREQTGR